MTPEGKVKKMVKEWLDEIGAYHFWPVPTGYGKRTLDCLVGYKGFFVAIETKRAKKDLTPFQKNTRTEIQEAGNPVLRIRDELELAEAKSYFKVFLN